VRQIKPPSDWAPAKNRTSLNLHSHQKKGHAMPKTFPINLEVEEIALGTVLRRLNDMPGIVKIDLNLGHGGHGPGRKQLEHHAKEARVQNASREPVALKMLMEGPKHIREISEALGGAKSRAYGLTNSLNKKGLVERGEGAGMWQLTKKAMHQLGSNARPVPQLPAPKVKHGPAGRAVPGSGPIILRAALDAGPKGSSDLRRQLAEQGMSTKSISGVLDRGKKQGLIKKNGADLYELTARGLKIELTTEVQANG
jgi:hypothetical protein